MRILRSIAVLALATGLSLPGALTGAGAAPTATAEPAAAAGPSLPGLYISPWGSAHVRVSDETAAWLQANDVRLGAISPFVLDPDGLGFEMPIGSSAGDHLDAQGRIFYPGGMTLTQDTSNTVVELRPTWIRLAPTPGYSAGIRLNGQDVSQETLIAYTTAAEVAVSGRPTPKGFVLDRVPFHVSADAAALTGQYFGSALRADSMFGTLTPRFDYVPPLF